MGSHDEQYINKFQEEALLNKPFMGIKLYKYECFGETLSFAESLGWVDWFDDIDVNDDTDPQTIDEAEADALDFIRAAGYTVVE